MPKADIVRCGEIRRYSITSSARASRDWGTDKPSAFAVFRLMASSLVRGLHRQISRFLAPQYAINVTCRASKLVSKIRPVGD